MASSATAAGVSGRTPSQIRASCLICSLVCGVIRAESRSVRRAGGFLRTIVVSASASYVARRLTPWYTIPMVIL